MVDDSFALEHRDDGFMYAKCGVAWWRLTVTYSEFVSWFASKDRADERLGQRIEPLDNPPIHFRDSMGWRYEIQQWDQTQHSYPPPNFIDFAGKGAS